MQVRSRTLLKRWTGDCSAASERLAPSGRDYLFVTLADSW